MWLKYVSSQCSLLYYFHVHRLIRLEFNSEGCGYYTELDAVELVGHSPSGMPLCIF